MFLEYKTESCCVSRAKYRFAIGLDKRLHKEISAALMGGQVLTLAEYDCLSIAVHVCLLANFT